MKNIFRPGDKKQYKRVVTIQDAAAFETGLVHAVYATFALARDAEWACRQFVLDMKDENEEGIGTYISINHITPALIGEEAEIDAEVKSINKNELICTFSVSVSKRLVATGETGQKIINREKLNSIFAALKNKIT